jgi:NAD(P)-dependent dehydrogenase (short-subunit alcohol dehydrogenase family)
VNSPFELTDRTVLVTGATGGIGFAICEGIARAGGIVIATGRNSEMLGNLRLSIGDNGHKFYNTEIRSETARAALIQELPLLHGVVHAAGILKLMPLRFIDEAEFQSITDTNYKVPVFFTQELLQNKKIAKGGSIVMIASAGTILGVAGNLTYLASKGALITASRIMAIELARQKIRVNCISPALVETPLLTYITEEEKEVQRQKHLLGLGQPEDVANTSVFLLSEASKWMTGSNLILDGGFSLK